MNCSDCKWSHDVGYALLCWGQKNAPRVDADSWCDQWKPKDVDGWVDTKLTPPTPYESVQVYLPGNDPSPTVHEGYYVNDDPSELDFFVVPALIEKSVWTFEEAPMWRPMAKPPEERK